MPTLVHPTKAKTNVVIHSIHIMETLKCFDAYFLKKKMRIFYLIETIS